MSYRRVSASEWEWQVGANHYAVHAFTKTRKLIWSSWVETSEAPHFDEGVAQTFEAFLRGEPPPNSPPDGLIDDVRAAISDEAKVKRGLFFRRK